MHFLVVLALIANVGCSSSEQKPSPSYECVVDGHGPYPYDLTQCKKVCEKQAVVSCVLQRKNSAIKMQFKMQPPPTSYEQICRAERQSDTGECVYVFDKPE